MSNIEFIAELEAIVKTRLSEASDKSYTASLNAAGPQRIAQKVGEEGVELALAGVGGNRDEIIDEASDLVYHVIVLLASQNISLEDISKRLQTRHR